MRIGGGKSGGRVDTGMQVCKGPCLETLSTSRHSASVVGCKLQ